MCASPDNVTIRPATKHDTDILIELRRAMFIAMGAGLRDIDDALPFMRDYFQRELDSGRFRVWVAEVHGTLVASIGLVIHSVPPSPGNTTGKEAYVMNLVTLPRYQRRGIARNLLGCVLEILRHEGIPHVSLHASSHGRRLYETLGFDVDEDLPEMKLRLE